MPCPPEIAEILRQILETGLLRIRSLAWSGDAAGCAVEADHIHNLPALLTHFDPEGLGYYWSVERAAYLSQIPESEHAGWEPLWERLRPHADSPAERAMMH